MLPLNMALHKKILLFIFIVGYSASAIAQEGSRQSWLFWTHTQKLSPKYSILADAQTRSDFPFQKFNTLLLRTALAFNMNDAHSLALGYAYKRDWMERQTDQYEHRIYQQYRYEFKVKQMEFEFRVRLEERFLNDNTTLFAMRSRGFIAAQFPIYTNNQFKSGLFAGIQNEIFFNILNKENVNNHFFDQNRPYISLGYRFSKKVETSIDYGLMADQGEQNFQYANVFRLSLTTEF